MAESLPQPAAGRPLVLDEHPLARSPLYGYHRTMLGLAIAVIVASFLFSVRTDRRVALGPLRGWAIPQLCQTKAVFGWDCPGCGLTRSFVHLAHGDFAASFQVHRLGWLVALGVVLQIPYRLWAMRSVDGSPLGDRLPWIGTWTLVVLLLANWTERLMTQLS